MRLFNQIFHPRIIAKTIAEKTTSILVKIISNLRKIISNVI